jgi:hypothetical protein
MSSKNRMIKGFLSIFVLVIIVYHSSWQGSLRQKPEERRRRRREGEEMDGWKESNDIEDNSVTVRSEMKNGNIKNEDDNDNDGGGEDNEENKKVSDWKSYFYSQSCVRHRMAPVGRIRYGTVGQGQRAKCVDMDDTEEFTREIPGSVDVSLTHKAIYIPVMKAGTQMCMLLLQSVVH